MKLHRSQQPIRVVSAPGQLERMRCRERRAATAKEPADLDSKRIYAGDCRDMVPTHLRGDSDSRGIDE